MNLGQTPIYLMMKVRDQYDICLISTIDLMLKNLIDRNKDNKSRKYRLERIHNLLLQMEEHKYIGSLPDAMVNKAERFNKMICSDLSSLSSLVGEK